MIVQVLEAKAANENHSTPKEKDKEVQFRDQKARKEKVQKSESEDPLFLRIHIRLPNLPNNAASVGLIASQMHTIYTIILILSIIVDQKGNLSTKSTN